MITLLQSNNMWLVNEDFISAPKVKLCFSLYLGVFMKDFDIYCADKYC